MGADAGAIALANMMHAVGHFKRNGRYSRTPYRNHYCAGSCDVASWEMLVGLGMARLGRAGSELTGGDPVYVVTDAGLEFLRRHRRATAKRARLEKVEKEVRGG
jgi:hypothetical protein